MKNPAGLSASKRFPKSHRLLKHAEFEKVYKQGRRHFAQHMTLFYLARETEDEALRVGFTVSKALGGAVQRNRIKRRLREAVRHNRVQRKVAADVVINPKRSLLTAEDSVLQNEIAKAFDVIEKIVAKDRTRN